MSACLDLHHDYLCDLLICGYTRNIAKAEIVKHHSYIITNYMLHPCNFQISNKGKMNKIEYLLLSHSLFSKHESIFDKIYNRWPRWNDQSPSWQSIIDAQSSELIDSYHWKRDIGDKLDAMQDMKFKMSFAHCIEWTHRWKNAFNLPNVNHIYVNSVVKLYKKGLNICSEIFNYCNF